MGIPNLKFEQFTYADYITWADEKRWEIVEGSAFDMTPAPGTQHQRISMYLSLIIGNYLRGKSCSVFSAPIDVRLANNKATDEETINVVQPDLLVICETSKIDERGIKGAPEWIIEITSPSTLKHDFGTKLLLYQKFGVREYWIIDPHAKTIHVFSLDISGKYNPGTIYKDEDIIIPALFQDLQIIPNEIFTP